MTESFVIPYPKSEAERKQWNRLYGFNAYYAGKHWTRRSEDANMWHSLVAYEMERQQVRKTPMERAVILRFYWNDRLDLSNHAVMAKMIEDAMKGRVIRDDSRKWVCGIEHYFHDEPYIRVVISEIQNTTNFISQEEEA